MSGQGSRDTAPCNIRYAYNVFDLAHELSLGYLVQYWIFAHDFADIAPHVADKGHVPIYVYQTIYLVLQKNRNPALIYTARVSYPDLVYGVGEFRYCVIRACTHDVRITGAIDK